MLIDSQLDKLKCHKSKWPTPLLSHSYLSHPITLAPTTYTDIIDPKHHITFPMISKMLKYNRSYESSNRTIFPTSRTKEDK